VTGRFDREAPRGGGAHAAPSGEGGRGHVAAPRHSRLPVSDIELARTLGQLFKFAIVGLVGFAFASVVLYAARQPFGLFGAGLLAYATTSTLTWALNRLWTFEHDASRPAHRQWALFAVTNTVGFALNWGTYALLVTLVRSCAEMPVLALAAGSTVGALANFTLCRAIVFAPDAEAAAENRVGRCSPLGSRDE
jgi:putative flippase GtrA